MINTYNVSLALYNQIKDYSTVKEFDPEVCHGEFVSVDPSRTPWIGVFRDRIRHVPRTLGHNTWQTSISLKVVVQAVSLESGEDCQNLLDGYVREVSAAILSDLTFGGAVLMTNAVDVEFNYIETERESFHYQSAVISIESEGRSNV